MGRDRNVDIEDTQIQFAVGTYPFIYNMDRIQHRREARLTLYVCGFLLLLFFFVGGKPREERWMPVRDIVNASGIQNLKTSSSTFGSLQGLASFEDKLFMFHTSGAQIVSITHDLKIGHVLYSKRYDLSVDFPKLLNLHVTHIGGVDVSNSATYGKEVWLACHGDGLYGEGAIIAVDPETLQVIPNRIFKVLGFNIDWVAYREDILYFGEFFDIKRILRVNIDTLKRMPDLKVDAPSITFIQSASFFNNALYLIGDDYETTLYKMNPLTGELISTQGLVMGNEVDGITFRNQYMYVGFNREKSHEQVMGSLPFVSIVALKTFTQY